jgi:hypothetical protein
VADGSSASAWFALIGALGGVVLTGTMSLVTAALNQRWNERDRTRAAREADTRATDDRLRSVSHTYLVAANRFYHVLDQASRMTGRGEQFDPTEHTRAAETAMQDAYMYLTICAGARVRELARAYNQSQYDLEAAAHGGDRTAWDRQARIVRQCRDELRAAIRAALGVQD